MSTLLKTKDTGGIGQDGQLNAIDRADVTIELFKPGYSKRAIGIAKSFTFNINKPKTPIEVLSQRNPAGYARNPEDRTFTMNQVNVFERLESISEYTNSDIPFSIQITYISATNDQGQALSGAKTKILTLNGVEFESVASSVDANGTEFTLDFTGKFRSSELSGDGVYSDYSPGENVLPI